MPMGRRFDISGLRVLAAAAAAAVVVLIVSLAVLGTSIDERGRRRELAVTAAELAQIVRDVQNRLGANTNWDPALLHIDNHLDLDWLQQNIVSPFEYDITGRLVMIYDTSDKVVFIRERARPVGAARAAAAEAAGRLLVARIRAMENARGRRGPPRSEADWVRDSAFVLMQGRPTLLNGGLVGPDLGNVTQIHAHAPVMIYTSDLQTVVLPALRARLLLRDARMSMGDTTDGGPSLKLRDTLGGVTATLSWTAERPGRDLLVGAAAQLLIIVAFLMGAVLIAYRQGSAGARALQASEARAHYLALHDGLTGLPNRRLLGDRLAQAVARTARHGGNVVVLLLDLDRFKTINDTYGHQCGDELIQEVASRLRRASRATDTCARLGGDEFVIVTEQRSDAFAAIFAGRLVEALAKPVQLSAALIHTSASIGISVSHGGTGQADDLLRQADLALYKAKESRNAFHFFEVEMDLALNTRRELERDLRMALTAQTLTLAYQLQFDGDRVIGVEALARWTHDQRGPVPPSLFIPLAEECGFIEELGRYVLGRAFADSRRWPGLKVAVNISVKQLRSPGFVPQVALLLAEHGVSAASFELEITESVLMADDVKLRTTLAALRRMGFTLSLDDFGTGYSSLSYLRRFPIDRIKLDRSFTAGIPDDLVATSIIAAIVGLAAALGLDLIAEGVETPAQMQKLAELGCTKIQGFLMCRPVPAGAIAALIGNGQSTGQARRRTAFDTLPVEDRS